MKRSIFVFLLFISSISFAQNGDKITYPRNTDELMNFMYQATLQGLRVIIVADSAGTTKTALDSAYATWAKQDTTNKRLDTLKTNILLLLTELAKKPNNNNADSLLNVGNLLTELAKVTNKLDSLFTYEQTPIWDVGFKDTVTYTPDSITISGYTHYVSISFWADSAYDISSTLAFTNYISFPAGWSYNLEKIPVANAGKFYIRKTNNYAGVMNWKATPRGN